MVQALGSTAPTRKDLDHHSCHEWTLWRGFCQQNPGFCDEYEIAEIPTILQHSADFWSNLDNAASVGEATIFAYERLQTYYQGLEYTVQQASLTTVGDLEMVKDCHTFVDNFEREVKDLKNALAWDDFVSWSWYVWKLGSGDISRSSLTRFGRIAEQILPRTIGKIRVRTNSVALSDAMSMLMVVVHCKVRTKQHSTLNLWISLIPTSPAMVRHQWRFRG